MSELLQIHPQPNYPHEDISEQNGDAIKQLVLDPFYVIEAAQLVEQNVITCSLGRIAITKMLEGLQVDSDQLSAFTAGIEAYQVLVMTVRPGPPPVQIDRLHTKCLDIVARQYDGFKAALSLRDSEEKIRKDAPITTEIIDRVSELHPRLDARLILQGASLEREIEQSAIVDIQDLEVL